MECSAIAAAVAMIDGEPSASRSQNSRTVHFRVTGRVQGVYFRAWMAEQAATLMLEGWVRNRRDGSIEALISGHADAVDRMLRFCRQGPPDAAVAQLEIVQEGGASPAGFAILPTA